MIRCSRRGFLKHAAAGGVVATFAISGTKASGRVLGANDRIRIAMAGFNGRGRAHLKCYAEMKDVEIAYLVDVDSRLFPAGTTLVQKAAGNTPQCAQDLRKVLEDKNLDAVSIATPNHTHSLLAIWCCQAGKDVYVEKPCSHNIFEGRKLVEASRKYDRIVQVGTQRRADPKWQKLIADLHKGKYGKLLISYGYASKPRPSIGFADPEQPPKELDYNLWLGPAAHQPYRKNLVPYNWHWVWEFGNGEIGNQGVHQLDVAGWAMPAGATPKSVISLGGRFGYKDQGETPNTQLTVIDFGDMKLFFEDRGLVTGKTAKVTNEFYTDEGVVKDGMFFRKGKQEGEPIEDMPDRNPGPVEKLHFRNFIDCMRSRKRDQLTAEILNGHRAALLAHLANTSYRLGEDVAFDKDTKAFAGDRTFHDSFEDMKQHLVDAAKLDLTGSKYRLGRLLHFDAQAERYVGDEEANKMLSRSYRAPFVVPEQV